MEKTKTCPYCGEEILAVAKKCKHCGEWLEDRNIQTNDTANQSQASPPTDGTLIVEDDSTGAMVNTDISEKRNSVTNTSNKEVICPYCGETNNAGDISCKKCGSYFIKPQSNKIIEDEDDDEQEYEFNEENANNKKRNKIKIYIICAFIILCCAPAIYEYFDTRNDQYKEFTTHNCWISYEGILPETSDITEYSLYKFSNGHFFMVFHFENSDCTKETNITTEGKWGCETTTGYITTEGRKWARFSKTLWTEFDMNTLKIVQDDFDLYEKVKQYCLENNKIIENNRYNDKYYGKQFSKFDNKGNAVNDQGITVFAHDDSINLEDLKD